jgi:hypothetical protein
MLSELKGKKIIFNISDDVSNYWIHSLTKDLKLLTSTNFYNLFYSSRFDFYVLNFDNKQFSYVVSLINDTIKNNYVHFIISDFTDINDLISYLDEIKSDNFNYSFLNYYSEVFYDEDPIDITKLKNFKYLFTSVNLLSKKGGTIKESDLITQLGDRYILDYKYSLIYYYIKLGFCYFQKGEHLFDNCNRLNKVFMYTKTKDAHRENQINIAIETGKIYNKEFDQDDWYWYYHNYNNYHIPFIIDYNICKLNIINETNPIIFEDEKNTPHFLSEKTLKGLFVPTPSYLLLQKQVYNDLKSYGFYFLNEEFESDGIENYKNFCSFLKNATDDEIDQMYQKTKVKSEQNKITLEKYISSDKTKEINLLINI